MKKGNIILIILIICILIIACYLIYRNNNSENNTNNINMNTSNVNTNNLTENKNNETNELDNFYDDDVTEKYVDIRDLDENYNASDAQMDNCFIVGAMVHNDNLYYEFMNNYNNKQKAFIRMVQNTTEGDPIIYDIKYDNNEDKVYVVTDSTRDEYAAQNDRKIELKEYEKIAEYEYKDHLYWVVYNGEINDETFNSDNVFILTTIN